MARLTRPAKLSRIPVKPKVRRQLPGQTLLRSPKHPEVMKHIDNSVYQFLRVQAISVIQAQRFGASKESVRKRFDTACDVEFHIARELDEDDAAYKTRCSERRKRFWRPSLKWAVDMLRYQPQGKGIWLPLNILDISLTKPMIDGGHRLTFRHSHILDALVRYSVWATGAETIERIQWTMFTQGRM